MEEIKAGDKMIGNYYRYRFNDKMAKCESIIKEDNWDGGYMVISECGQKTGIGSCVGIPLTEDILLKAGFKEEQINPRNASEGMYYTLRLSNDKYCDLAFISSDKNGFIEVCLFPYEDNFRVRFVHQLQNLFFILSGNQLIINI